MRDGGATSISVVMPGFMPGIHVFPFWIAPLQDVDGRDKPGHDESNLFGHFED